MQSKKTERYYSIAALLIAIFLAGIAGVSLVLSLVMLIPFRSEVYNNAVEDNQDNVSAIRNDIVSFYQNHSQLLHSAGIGGRSLIARVSGPGDTANQAIFQDFLKDMAATSSDILVMYFTTSGKWNEGQNWVIESNGYRPKTDWDNTQKDWYKMAMAASGGSIICTEPYLDAMTGKVCITLACQVIGTDGKALGVLAEDILTDTLASNLKKETNNGSMSWLLDNDGKYLTNADQSKIMKTDFFTDMGLESYRPQIISKSSQNINTGSEILSTHYISEANWYLVYLTPDKIIFSTANSIIRQSVIMLVLFIAVITAALVFIIRRIVKPIVSVSSALQDIAHGEGDLTRTLKVSARNEIGELAKYFNETMGKIKNMVTIIKHESDGLSNVGKSLASEMTNTASAVDEITGNISSIKSQVENQSASVDQTNFTMQQITGNIDSMAGQIEIQSEAVSKSSAAVEQMIANIQSVTSTLKKNAASVQALKEAADAGRVSVQDVSADIQEISKESEGLMEINAVMENIASQTNLLAMNAAIEAAHAGEAGKGFAVVADEIRKLAENSSDQSKTISAVLKKIKSSIDKIGGSTGAVLQKFEAIDEGVNTVSSETENIKTAMEEQSEGSKQILDVVSQLDDTTAKVKSAALEMSEGSKQVLAESRNLEQVTSEIANSMNEMAIGVTMIDKSINQVNGISGDNEEKIKTLAAEVNKFKVD
jgi:methyl-accepting chemotaxis protein